VVHWSGLCPQFVYLLCIPTGGADGDPANNCILYGGVFQVIASKTAYNREDTLNVKVQGLTFRAGGAAGALLVTPGDIQFIDCIFRVSHSLHTDS